MGGTAYVGQNTFQKSVPQSMGYLEQVIYLVAADS